LKGDLFSRAGGIGIFKNFGYLSIIQVFNLIFPLLIYPYVIRVVGKENYGLILFVQSITIYFSLITNFGFNIYGTNEISLNKDSKNRLAKIIGAILFAQFGLLLISMLLLVLLSFLFHEPDILLLFLLSSYLCLNEIFIPVWYFQGMENMKYIALCNFISKLSSTALIFIFVKGEGDYIHILTSYFVGTLLCGLFAFFKIFISDRNRMETPSFSTIIETLKSSFPLFVSHSLGGVTAKSNSFIIGKFVGKVELAYYDLAEKIINILASFFQNFSNALFPSVAKSKSWKLAKNGIRMATLISIVTIFSLGLFSDYIVEFIGGSTMGPASWYLILLSISLIFRAVGPIVSTSILVVNNLSRALVSTFLSSFLIYVLGLLFLFFFDVLTTTNIIFVFLISLLFRILHRVFVAMKKGLTKWII
jgi:PST family polysaccharide transporter